MTLRYAAAGFLEAERGFRRIKGYKQRFFSALLPLHQIPRNLDRLDHRLKNALAEIDGIRRLG